MSCAWARPACRVEGEYSSPGPKCGPRATARRSRSLAPASDSDVVGPVGPRLDDLADPAVDGRELLLLGGRGDLALGDVVGVAQRADVHERDGAPVEVLEHLGGRPLGALLDRAVGPGPAHWPPGSHRLDAEVTGGRRVAEQAQLGVEALAGGGLLVLRPLGDLAVDDGGRLGARPVGGVRLVARAVGGGAPARREPQPAVGRARVRVHRAHGQGRRRPVAQEQPEVRGRLLVDVGPADPSRADDDDGACRLVRSGVGGPGRGPQHEPHDRGRQGDRDGEGSAQHGARLRGSRWRPRIARRTGWAGAEDTRPWTRRAPRQGRSGSGRASRTARMGA